MGPAVETDRERVRRQHAVELGEGRLQPSVVVVVGNTAPVAAPIVDKVGRIGQHEIGTACRRAAAKPAGSRRGGLCCAADRGGRHDVGYVAGGEVAGDVGGHDVPPFALAIAACSTAIETSSSRTARRGRSAPGV